MTPRGHRFLALLLAGLVGLAACGVSADGDPQAIAAEDVPFSLLEPELSTSSTEPPSADTETASFYLIQSDDDDTYLAEVTREVPLSSTPGGIIRTLLELQPDEDDQAEVGLITNIPEDTTLLGAVIDEGLLVLDFGENLLTVEGPAQTGLFAQIVCTATEIEGVTEVRFRIDGEPVDASIDDSELTSEPVDCSSYLNFRQPADS